MPIVTAGGWKKHYRARGTNGPTDDAGIAGDDLISAMQLHAAPEERGACGFSLHVRGGDAATGADRAA